MATEDQASERLRLAKLYASMSDRELQQIADDAGSLTEVAIQVLADEVQRRGLDFVLAESAVPMKDVNQSELVTIHQFRDLPEALLAKGTLESAGIDSYFADDNMVRLDWFISNLIGGIKLKVRKEDEEEALQVLNQPIPEDFEVEGWEKYQQPRCPRCGSLDINHEAGLDKRFALPGLALGGFPVPVPRDVWKCQSCEHEWHDVPSSETDTQNKE
jgi:hypothetical protein